MGPGESHLTHGPFGDMTPEQMRAGVADYSKLSLYEQDFREIVDKARHCVADVLAGAEGFTAHLQQQAERCWEKPLEKASKLLEKMYGKALLYSVVKLNEAYSDSVRFGIRIPSAEELLQSYGDPPPLPIKEPVPPPPPPPPPPVPPITCPHDTYPCAAPDGSDYACVLPSVKMPDGTIVRPTVQMTWPEYEFIPQTSWANDCSDANMVIADPTGKISTEIGIPPQDVGGLGAVYGPQITWTPTGTIGSGGNPHFTLSTTPVTPGGAPPYQPPAPTGLGPGGMGGPAGSLTTTGGGAPSTQQCPCPAQPQQLPLPVPVTLRTEPPPPGTPQTDYSEPGRQVNISTWTTEPYESWCKSVQLLCEMFVSIGKALRDGDGDYVVKKVFHLGSVSESMPTLISAQFIAEVMAMFSNDGAGEVMPKLFDGMTALGIGSIDNLRYLYTCKAFFIFLNDATIDAQTSASTDAEGGVSVPRIIELVEPLHASTVTKTNAAATIKGSWHPFFIPLLDMVDVCIRYTVPTTIPGIPEAIDEYLKGRIDEEHCRCLVELNGGRWREWQHLIGARREQLNPEEIIQLWLRAKLNDEQVDHRLRNTGMTVAHERQEKRELAQEIPPITDLLRFMTKNIYNEDVVNRFKLDDALERTVNDQLQYWIKAQGITPEAVKAYWREHWGRPAPGQVAEMVQRLRPEVYGEQEGTITTTVADFKLLMLENDWLPFWQERMAELIYRPIPMRQLTQAYALGQITRERLISGLQDVGYKLDKAQEFAKAGDVRRRKTLEADEWIKAYGRNGVNRNFATQLLLSEGYQEEEINNALDVEEMKMDIGVREACVVEIQKRLRTGDLLEQEARDKLLQHQLDPEQVDRIINLSGCFHKAQSKHEKAIPLCDYYMKGLISPDDFIQRARHVGYSEVDSNLLLKRCNIRLAEEERKVAEKEFNREKAARRKKIKAEQTAAKQRGDLLKLAEKVAELNSSRSPLEAANVARAMDDVMATHAMPWLVAYYVVINARDALPKKGPVDIYQLIIDAGNAYPELPIHVGNGEL